jgi:hypothetical protein
MDLYPNSEILAHVANVVRGDRIVNASRIKRLDGRGKSAATAGIGRDQRELVLDGQSNRSQVCLLE